MTKQSNSSILFIVSLVILAGLSRLLPHPPNFTPIAAIALFGGIALNSRWLAFVLPFAALFLSDLALEQVSEFGGFHNTMPYVYSAFLITALIGRFVKTIGGGFGRTLAACVISSVLFFLITNFGVWAAGGFIGGIAGLNTTFMLGVPFYTNTLIGDLVYTGTLFGIWNLLKRSVPALA